MNWTAREIEPLLIRFERMANEEAGSSVVHKRTHGGGSKIFVHPENFYGYPNDDVIDWFSSFERIARANEWNGEKQGRMVSAYFSGPAGDHFEKIKERDKTNYAAVKKSLID